MSILMYDTITLETMPAAPEAVAGYVGGHWPTYEPLVWKFPHAKHLSIAVNAGEDATCLDVERGDADPVQAPAWVKRQQARGVVRPVVYCSVSTAATLLGGLASEGVGREAIRLWTAHYTDKPHLCTAACGGGFAGTADATQFTCRALGRNLDESVCSDAFFPAPVDPHHYERYPNAPFAIGRLKLNERATVQEYDSLITHPKQNRARIQVLRQHIRLLRDRVWTVAHWETPPNWDYFRGFRWQKLNDRLSGPVKL